MFSIRKLSVHLSIAVRLLSLNLNISPVLSQSAWPQGTDVNASSVHPPAPDVVTQYNANLAIDGNYTTFWCDDTEGIFPDVITLQWPSLLKLRGINLLTSSDQWVTQYHVDGFFANDSYVDIANVTDVSGPNSTTQFPPPFQYSSIRIQVWGVSPAAPGDAYSRIHEIVPLFADDSGPASKTSQSTSSAEPGPQPSQDTTPSPKSQTAPVSKETDYTGVIIGAIGGSALVVIIVVLTTFRISRRSRRGLPQVWERERPSKLVISSPRLIESPVEAYRAVLGLKGPAEIDILVKEFLRSKAAEIKVSGPKADGIVTPIAELAGTSCDQRSKTVRHSESLESLPIKLDQMESHRQGTETYVGSDGQEHQKT